MLFGAAAAWVRSASRTIAAILVATSAWAQPPERVRILIGFRNLPGPAEEAIVHGVGGTVRHRYHLVNAIAASVPVTAIDGLRRNPRVSVVEPDGLVQALDLELDNAWGVKRIGAGSVHAGGNRGQGVRVAILDTGIDCTHPDLDGNCAGGVDFANDDSDPRDDHGHGTHVAGTVAAEDDGTGVVGVAPKALLYAVKVMGSDGSGYWSDIVAGIQWAADNGAKVMNHSYGGPMDPGTVARAAFDNSRAAGVIHLAAAGNAGTCPPGGDSVNYPAKYASVIAVAAINNNDQRACFSSTGAKVEVAAPGVSIYSTRAGGGYVLKSGTSMASPHAAGVAALIVASGITSPADVRQRMLATADDLGVGGRDDLYGYGRVDAVEAAGFSQTNTTPTVTISAPTTGSTFSSWASIAFRGSATDNEDGTLTSTLQWRSNLDGAIGTGGSFSTVLRDGSHTISASTTDSEGRTSTRSISLNVSSSTSTMRAKFVRYWVSSGDLAIRVRVVDGSDVAIRGAAVTFSTSNERSSRVYSVVTNYKGQAVGWWENFPAGCYKTVVTSVTASGFVWDGTTPTNKYCR